MHALCLLLFTASLHPAAAPSKVPEGTFHLEREARSARCVVLKSTGGDVRIRGHRGTQVVVDGARSLGGPSCSVQVASQGSRITVTATDPRGQPCLVDLQIKVPQALELDVHGGSGNVFVSGLRAAMALDLAQGNAVLGGVFSKFKAHLSEGSLSVQGLAGQAHVEVEHGNVQMFVAPEASGKAVPIDFKVGTGNVTLVAPHREASVQVSCQQGQVHSSLDDGGASSKLAVKGEVAHGNFTLRAGS